MKVAVLSDIHSNYHALEACCKDAVNCGACMFIFLGDYVSDLSEPQRTMDLVYEIQSKNLIQLDQYAIPENGNQEIMICSTTYTYELIYQG